MRRGNRARRVVVVMLALGVTLGAWLGACRQEPLESRRVERAGYLATFRDVGGLRPGDPVRYAGLAVGAVDGIELDSADPRRVVVSFRIRKDIPLRADARAVVPLVNVPVGHYLSLVPASRDAPRLPPGSVVASAETRALPEVMQRVAEVLDRTDTLLAAARPLVEARTFEHLASVTARLDALTALATGPGAQRVLPGLGRIVSRTDLLLGRTNEMLAAVDSSRAELAAIPGTTVQTLQETQQTLEETRAMLAELREGLAQGGGLADIVRDLSTSGRNLARLTTELERDPLSPLKARGAPAKPAGPRP